MEFPNKNGEVAQLEFANRIFFRLYQCANMLHKTGSRAVEQLGLTTQQWAVLGALSRPEAERGMGVGELARYLMVSRQNLSGLVGRMERDGHLELVADPEDRRSRLVRMTAEGSRVWRDEAPALIQNYYEQALADFSVGDTAHLLHYLLKLLDNMQAIDVRSGSAEEAPAEQSKGK